MSGVLLAALQRAASNETREISSAGKKKKGKKKGKQCGQKEAERCAADAAACRQLVLAECDGSADCLADTLPCCDTCAADGFLNCLLVRGASKTTIARFG